MGRELLSFGKANDICLYRANYVREQDIPTAISALEYPACAHYAGKISKAIVERTSHTTASQIDRWKFAKEWLGPNAYKYHYNPERFNSFYYCYVR